MPAASGRDGVEMYQKRRVPSVFMGVSTSQPASVGSDIDIDTEFEEDLSDFEDYGGRRSEESVGYPVLQSTETADTSHSLAIQQSRQLRNCGHPHPMTSRVSILGFLFSRISQGQSSRFKDPLALIYFDTRRNLPRRRSSILSGRQSNLRRGLAPPLSDNKRAWKSLHPLAYLWRRGHLIRSPDG